MTGLFEKTKLFGYVRTGFKLKVINIFRRGKVIFFFAKSFFIIQLLFYSLNF